MMLVIKHIGKVSGSEKLLLHRASLYTPLIDASHHLSVQAEALFQAYMVLLVELLNKGKVNERKGTLMEGRGDGFQYLDILTFETSSWEGFRNGTFCTQCSH